MLIGVTINFPPKSPLQKLTEARALWQAKGSKDYQMDIAFSSFSFIGGYRIVVHDNQVTDVFGPALYDPNASTTSLKPVEGKILQADFFAQAISPDFKDYTVDGLFDIAAPKLTSASPIVTWCNVDAPSPDIRYNSEYGYIQRYDLGDCPKWEIGGGMLCPTLSDCNAAMRVRNFEILPPG